MFFHSQTAKVLDGVGKITVDSVMDFLDTLKSPEDLKQIKAKIESILIEKPLELLKNEQFDEALEIFDNGQGGDLSSGVKIFPGAVHSLQIKGKDGAEMQQVRVAHQQGMMYAGTTIFEAEYVQIGDLVVTDRLPDHAVEMDGLIKHIVKTKDEIESFLSWVIE